MRPQSARHVLQSPLSASSAASGRSAAAAVASARALELAERRRREELQRGESLALDRPRERAAAAANEADAASASHRALARGVINAGHRRGCERVARGRGRLLGKRDKLGGCEPQRRRERRGAATQLLEHSRQGVGGDEAAPRTA